MPEQKKKTRYTLSEAAKIIGITSGRLRQLVIAGKLQVRTVEAPASPRGYYYEISEAQIRRYMAKPRRGGRRRIGDPKRKLPGSRGNGQNVKSTRPTGKKT